MRTKLYIPRKRPDLVPRPRLIERLEAGLQRKLTLVSAPTGFGKTTLLSEWIHSWRDKTPALRAAWLSLDEQDNDPRRFLSYLVAALQTIQADVAQDLLIWLQTPQHTAQTAETPGEADWIWTALTRLLNEATSIPGEFLLFLDDYHEIQSTEIHDTIRILIDYAPPHMHLVIASRSDPPLKLPLLRARCQLNELREAELRFTLDEVTAFLNQTMRLGLSTGDVRALEARTEGWIAGLQLAALAMQETLSTQGRADVDSFIRAFTGSHRYILDYLTDEVLCRQPERVQLFLLQTSILDQLTGSLCDAITGWDDGQKTLAMLEAANLFLIPLDDKRLWYRYHPLFSDLLRHRLARTMADLAPGLHRRASEWYARNERMYEALGHALAINDYELAARLIEEAGPAMAMRGEAATLFEWLDAMPEPVVRSRPRLSLTYAWILFVTSNMAAIEPRLQDALKSVHAWEESQASARHTKTLQVEEILNEISVLRAFVAVYRGEAELAIDLCSQARQRIPQDRLIARTGVCTVLGDAHLALDRIGIAEDCYREAVESSYAAGNTVLAMVMLSDLARLRVTQGRLHDAARLFQQVLEWGGRRQIPLYPVGQAYVGLGDIWREWNDLEAAETHLTAGLRHTDRGGYTRYSLLGNISLARIKCALGDKEGMLAFIERAEQLAAGTGVSQFTRQAAAYRARMLVCPGIHDVAAASIWVRDCGPELAGEARYAHELEYLTLARVLLAESRERMNRAQMHGLQRVLARLLSQAENAGRTGSVVEILLITALIWQELGSPDRAGMAVDRALELSRPEGFVRLYLDEGPPMADLLKQATHRGAAANYVRRLLEAFGASGVAGLAQADDLAEPLTEREIEVLRLLAVGLSNREIAAELVVSLTTVKAHARHIYNKLDVQNRTQAAARARELNLL
ncbi:MAG: LuxR C-terminal-related transcriptional regulator [Chloroflexota bacterium]